MTADTDLVDRLTRRRALIATCAGALFIATGGFTGLAGEIAPGSAPLRALAWSVWIALLLLFLLFGGGLWRGASVRARMNDETTQAHRREALIWAFWYLLGGAAFCYMRGPLMSGREAVHFIVTLGVSAALLRFGFLESRALKE